MNTQKLCECGCGEYAKPGDRFIYGHRSRVSRGSIYWKKQQEPQLCECGCGEYAKPGNRFIHEHSSRGSIYWKKQQEPQLCECGCGEYAKPGDRFIHGHNWKNREKMTDEQRAAKSKSMLPPLLKEYIDADRINRSKISRIDLEKMELNRHISRAYS